MIYNWKKTTESDIGIPGPTLGVTQNCEEI